MVTRLAAVAVHQFRLVADATAAELLLQQVLLNQLQQLSNRRQQEPVRTTHGTKFQLSTQTRSQFRAQDTAATKSVITTVREPGASHYVAKFPADKSLTIFKISNPASVHSEVGFFAFDLHTIVAVRQASHVELPKKRALKTMKSPGPLRSIKSNRSRKNMV